MVYADITLVYKDSNEPNYQMKFIAIDIDTANEYIKELEMDDTIDHIEDIFIDGNYGTVVVLPEDYEY